MTSIDPTSAASVFATLGGWSGVLNKVIGGSTLDALEAHAVMNDVLTGGASSTQLAAFVAVLRARNETVEELSGLSAALLEAAVPVPELADSVRARSIDTCGTGGDRSGTINVSTMAALVVAAAGVPVAKHGNRAATSQAGSADVLEALGVAIDLGSAGVAACVTEANFGFFLASSYHPGFKYVMPMRRELGVGTAFNFMGPLINPARLQHQVIGISDPSVASLMLGVLEANGAQRAMIVHGADGLDEITTTTSSTVLELRDGHVQQYEIHPERFGIALADPASLKGGSPAENAERVRRIIDGQAHPQSDIVALNAAAGLIVGGAVDTFEEGYSMARDLLRNGGAADVLANVIRISQREAASEKREKG